MNRYAFDDINVGLEESFKVTITEEMMSKFKSITGDDNPLHNDKDYAHANGYIDRVVYGMLSASFLSTLAGVYLPGEKSLIQSTEIKFVSPVFIGDTLTIVGTVAEKHDIFNMFIMKVIVRNQNNKKVIKGNMQIGLN